MATPKKTQQVLRADRAEDKKRAWKKLLSTIEFSIGLFSKEDQERYFRVQFPDRSVDKIDQITLLEYLTTFFHNLRPDYFTDSARNLKLFDNVKQEGREEFFVLLNEYFKKRTVNVDNKIEAVLICRNPDREDHITLYYGYVPNEEMPIPTRGGRFSAFGEYATYTGYRRLDPDGFKTLRVARNATTIKQIFNHLSNEVKRMYGPKT